MLAWTQGLSEGGGEKADMLGEDVDALLPADHILGHAAVDLGAQTLAVGAQVVVLGGAAGAVAAGGEGGLAGHPIAHLDMLDVGTHSSHNAGELMAQYHRGLGAGIGTLEGVEISAADARVGDFYLDQIAGGLGLRDVLVYHIVIAGGCFHDCFHD